MPLRKLAVVTLITLGVTALLALAFSNAPAVAFLVVAAFAIAAVNFGRLVKLIRVGADETLGGAIVDRVQNVLYYIFREKKLLEDFNAGAMHLFFLYGFIVLSVGHFELIAREITAPWIHGGLGFHLLDGKGGFFTGVYHVFLFSQDLAAVLIIPFSVIAMIRRWVYIPARLKPRSQDAENILWFIIVLYISFFVLNGAEVSLGSASGWFRPFSSWSAMLLFGLGDAAHGVPAVSSLFGVVAPETVKIWMQVALWTHLFVFLAFLNYLPYSKHLHLIAAFPNIYLRREGPRAQPSLMDFEESETFGKSQVEQFSYKTILDSFSCTECGRCEAVCPAHLTNKALKPKKVVHDLKVNLYKNELQLVPWKNLYRKAQKDGTDLPEAPEERSLALITQAEIEPKDIGYMGKYPTDGQIHVDEIWACTTCAACVEACPVLIESVPVSLIDLRRHLVMMEADFPGELTQAFKGMEVQANPWAIGGDKREEWCENIDVPKIRDQEGREVDYLFWVGCAGATDDRAKKIQQAFAKILNKAGVDYAILGKEEKCTGDPARRMGNEYLFASMVEENRGIFDQYKFKKVVTTCPHCLNSLKNDYRQFGIELDVVHHTDLIWKLLDEDKIRLDKEGEREAFTYHDPCYLGRYNDSYDKPREVIKQVEGLQFVEMDRNKEKSFCCGAGGGRMWLEENQGERINNARTEQAVDTGAKNICVACPFCMTMIEDGTKAKDIEEEVKVLDVAELVAKHLL